MPEELFVDGKPATALGWLKMMRERDKHEPQARMSHYTLDRLIEDVAGLEKRLAFYEQHTSKQANELVVEKRAAEALRRQEFNQAHGLRAEVQPLDATKMIVREGWFCTSCGHRHAGETLANICVGCSCSETTPLGGSAEDDWIRIATENTKDAAARLASVTAERDKWLAAFNRSEQFQSSQTMRAEMAAREELKRILADYLEAADGNMDWFWVDQIEDRIRALDAAIEPRNTDAK